MKRKKITEEEAFEKIQNTKWAVVMEKVYCLIILNVCIILFSSLGLFVFGVGPAIYTAFKVLKMYEGLKFPAGIFKEFWSYFKSYILIGNIYFYSILITVLLLSRNIGFYTQSTGVYSSMGLYIMVTIGLILLPFILSLYPVEMTYQEKSIYDRLKISFYMMFLKPVAILKAVLLLGIFSVVIFLFPQFTIFFGFATPIYCIFKPLNSAIEDILEKNKSSIEGEL